MNQKHSRKAQKQKEIISLNQALRTLTLEMADAATAAEAEEGLKRLQALEGELEALRGARALSQEAVRDLETEIAWLKVRLEKLRESLARKRRFQEGEALEQLAQARETAVPSLSPTLGIDPVVRATVRKDAPVRPKPTPVGQTAPETPAAPTAEQEAPVQSPAEDAGQAWEPERLVAHLAASVREQPDFFETLGKQARRKQPKLPLPTDDREAEAHYRAVRSLGQRLVNLELHCKAAGEAFAAGKPVSRLVQTASRELTAFRQELRERKQALPGMAGEYDRLFGGWAEQLDAMKPTKGGALLEACRSERQREQSPRQAEPRQREVLQLVLKRDS